MMDKIISNPKQLFLIDSIGALISAFSLGVVLVQLEIYFGMPSDILYILAAIPCFFIVYSFLCYWRFPKRWQPFMKGIAIANLAYCVLSMILVYQYHEQLTTLGFVYFLLEFFIVITIVYIELRAARTH